MSKMIDIKAGDKIYIPIYDGAFPSESYVAEYEIFDVGKKGIYINCDGLYAEFLSYDECGKTFFTSKQDAQKELSCMLARGANNDRARNSEKYNIINSVECGYNN